MSVLGFLRSSYAESSQSRVGALYAALSTAIILFFLVIAALPQAALAAKLLVVTPKQAYSVGETIQAVINVSSTDAAVNAFSGTMTFPKDMLQATAVSKTGSVVSVWAEEPTFSNADGTVHFEGVAMNPGYSGSAGKIITVTFKVKTPGVAELVLTGGSVLANDGQGTNVLTDMVSTEVVLGAAKAAPQATTPAAPVNSPELTPVAPDILSSTHPDSGKWYSGTEASFQWEVPESVTAVRFVADKKPRTVPTGSNSASTVEKKVTGLDDGVYYFHLQFKNKYGWGAVSHYRFQVDSKPPQQFAVTLPGGDTTDDPRPAIAFKAVDDLSGIDHYELTFFTKENEVTTVRPEDMPNGTYQPAPLAPGKKLLIVKAFDKAGNKTTETSEFTIREVKGLIITSYPDHIDENSAIRITGRTFPQSTIVFTLSDAASGQQFTDQTQSTAMGEFSMTWGKKVPAGVYELTAVNTDQRGAISTLDPALKIEVTRSMFARLWTLILNYLSVIVLGALGLLGAGVVVWFVRHKITLMRKRLNAQVSDADAVVHSTLNLLREDIAACTELLKRANSAGDLAKEGELLKRLSSDLNQVEELIENKVHKIGE